MSAALLPAALRERLRAPNAISGALPTPRASGSHVLYILRTAHRCEGNPSLEVALRMAAALELPLRCVAVVEDSFPPSSRAGRSWRPTDRAAAFRLEALREMQPAFAERGTELLVHVERDGCRAAVCMSLAAKAALVVADEPRCADADAGEQGQARAAMSAPRGGSGGAGRGASGTREARRTAALTRARISHGAAVRRRVGCRRSCMVSWVSHAIHGESPRAPPHASWCRSE